MSNVYRDYLLDLGDEIRRRALDAKADRDSSEKGTEDERLDSGRVLAFYEVLTLMIQSALGLGIPLEDLRLQNFNPDRDLL